MLYSTGSRELLNRASSKQIEAVDFTHQFVSRDTCSISTIDHFVSNQQVILATKEAGVIHHPENTSNHSPIFASIDAGSLHVDVENSKTIPRTCWSKATEEAKAKYKDTIATKLNLLLVPDCIHCTDFHCSAHKEEISNYTIEVLEAVEAAARETLPFSGIGSRCKSK